MRWRKVSLILVILAAVGGGVAWAYGLFSPPSRSPEFVELQTKMTAVQELPPEKRFDQMRQMRDSVQKLPEQEQQQFHQLARETMHREMENRMKEYFALPPEQRKAFLDKDIDRMRAMEARFASQAPRPGGAGGPGGAANNTAAGAPAGAGAPPPGPPGGGPPGAGPGPRRGMRGMLDNMTPEFRAQMGEYIRDMRQRRKERGLPEMRGPFGR